MLKNLIRVTALAAALAALPTASAGAALVETEACDDATLSQPFQNWGDQANYRLVPGGDFEGSLDGWALKGARVVDGSNSHGVTGEVGDHAVSLPPGASITTPATCVNAAYPTFRFFARSSGGLLGLLPAMKVDLVYRDSALRIIAVPIGVVLPSGSWQPTLPFLTASAVAGLLNGGEAKLAYRFTSLAGTWKVDDVFVDPMRRG
jgi:hypothetical protein